MNEKVYTPTVIQETPFPGDLVEFSQSENNTSLGGNYKPSTTRSASFPKKRTAIELLSTALNTRSRKILEEFELQQSGGLKIGDFKEGISGDVRITPNGLTGRNLDGLTTFALDTDGNLILVGELRSGSLITGDVILQDGGKLQIGSDEGDTLIDEDGIVSINNFQTGNSNGTPNTAFTTSSYVSISGSSLSLTLRRQTRVLILLTVQSAHAQTAGGSDMSGRVFYTVHIDDSAQLPEILIDTSLINASGIKENVIRKVYSTSFLKTLNEGTHTIDARYKIDSASNITATLHTYDLTYIVLGS